MCRIMFIILLIFLLYCPSIASVRIGFIRNVSVIAFNPSPLSLTTNIQQCFCYLTAHPSFYSFNYFLSNQTCQFLLTSDQTKPYTILSHASSAFYFLSLPFSNIFSNLMWSFDSTLTDQSQMFEVQPRGNVSFSSLTITGYGSSLSLLSNLSQGLIFPSPSLNLANRSWTFELWIYLFDISSTVDYAIIGQCDALLTQRCLHLLIRQSRLYLGFYHDDLAANRILASHTWYHVAFVFDCSTRNQSIYLNGVLDRSRQSSACYQGTNGSLTFGLEARPAFIRFFNGLMDQLSFTNRIKTPNEILRDATLTFYYSFDNQMIDDHGPLQINAVRFGHTSFIDGRRDTALAIRNATYSYLVVQGLVLLGTSGLSYSLSLWIRPNRIQRASLVHISSEVNGLIGWCLSLLGLTSSGELMTVSWNGSLITTTGPVPPTNVWTHVAISYSDYNGLRLYINGTLFNMTTPFIYASNDIPVSLFLGSSLNHTGCESNDWIGGQYEGDVDDFRLFSRELIPSNVFDLANL